MQRHRPRAAQFADGADSFVMALGRMEITCHAEQEDASQAKSVRAQKTKNAAQQKFEGLLGELDGALEKLGLRAEQIKEALQRAAGRRSRSAGTFSPARSRKEGQ